VNEKHIHESTNCPYKSFRDFNRKLVEIKSTNENFDNYGIEELTNPFIGYLFIDKEDGVCVRILGNKNNKKLIEKLIKEDNIAINCDYFNDLEFKLLEDEIETFDLEKQMDEYYKDKELLELREITEIDNLRGIYYPDDVLLTLEFEDNEVEYLWGRLDGYISEVDKCVVYLLQGSEFDYQINSSEYAVCKYIKTDSKEELIIQGILEKVEEDD
jgi:hypothetical protein